MSENDRPDTAPPPALEREAQSAGAGLADSRSDRLMPLEAAAKAIFVKANGLAAYKQASGFTRRATD